MGIREALQQPDPVQIRISSTANREQFAATLAAAVCERRYSDPRGSDVFLRLRSGMVNPDMARFTVKTYVMPGVWSRSMDKLVIGSFRDTPDGSEFTALVSVPIGKLAVGILVGWVAFIGLMFFAQAVATAINRLGGDLLAGLTSAALLLLAAGVIIFAPLAVLWPLILRQNQRGELSQLGSLTRFLDVIAMEAGHLNAG